jgi:uncharacterized protein
MAQLLEWHRREDKASWWRYFDLLDMTDDERFEAKEPLARIEPVGDPEISSKGYGTWTFRFPEQEHGLDAGTEVWDPSTQADTRAATGKVTFIDDTEGIVRIYRSRNQASMPLPTSLVPNGIIPTRGHAQSLKRTAAWIADNGIGAAGPELAAARALLLRRPPRAGSGVGTDLRQHGERSLDAAVRLGLELDGDVLAIQGPPHSRGPGGRSGSRRTRTRSSATCSTPWPGQTPRRRSRGGRASGSGRSPRTAHLRPAATRSRWPPRRTWTHACATTS